MAHLNNEPGPQLGASNVEDSPSSPRIWWVLWIALLIAWTIALWVPVQGTSNVDRSLPAITKRFLFSKVLHLVVYSALAGVIPQLPISLSARWIPVYLLMLHASLTEVCQLYWFGRSGLVLDVALNHVGIGIGLVSGMCYSAVRTSYSEPSE